MSLELHVLESTVLSMGCEHSGFARRRALEVAIAAARHGASVTWVSTSATQSPNAQHLKTLRSSGVQISVERGKIGHRNTPPSEHSIPRVSQALEIDSEALRVLFRPDSLELRRAVHVVCDLSHANAIEQCGAVVEAAIQCGLQVSVDVTISSAKILADLLLIKESLSGISWALLRVDDALRLGLKSRRRQDAYSFVMSLFPQQNVTVGIDFDADGFWLQCGQKFVECSNPSRALNGQKNVAETFWGNCLADWMLHPVSILPRLRKTLNQSAAACRLHTMDSVLPPTLLDVHRSLEQVHHFSGDLLNLR